MKSPGWSLLLGLVLVATVSAVRAEGWRDWVPFAGQDESAAKSKKASSPNSRAKDKEHP